jgi:putative nucleotidyltransferase with HDIG domain
MNKDNKKIKVLVAEDDEKSLKLLTVLLESYGYAFDTAENGLEAWEKIQKNDYDLILSDWNMPRLDGNQLLKNVRENGKTNKTPFLMVTARTDVGSIGLALKAGVTEYVIKPFDQQTLYRKIEKLLKKQPEKAQETKKSLKSTEEKSLDRKSVSLKVMELIGQGKVSIPAMPQVVFEVEKIIKKEDVNLHDLAEIVAMDAGIASKLIGVSNSVAYRGLKECANVEEAVGRIGMKETKQLVNLIANRNMFALKDRRFEVTIQDLYVHSVAVGATGQLLAKHLNIPEPDKIYLMGLLHDIGKLLVLQVLSELTKDMLVIDQTFFEGIMNELHNKVGAMLLARWSFSPLFSSVAMNHQDITAVENPEKELLIVHFANIFVRELAFSLKKEIEKNILMSESAVLLGLNAEMLEKVAAEVKVHVEKITSIM